MFRLKVESPSAIVLAGRASLRAERRYHATRLNLIKGLFAAMLYSAWYLKMQITTGGGRHNG
jgi:hypothetical protein